jgi:hypothetical protein
LLEGFDRQRWTGVIGSACRNPAGNAAHPARQRSD